MSIEDFACSCYMKVERLEDEPKTLITSLDTLNIHHHVTHHAHYA